MPHPTCARNIANRGACDMTENCLNFIACLENERRYVPNDEARCRHRKIADTSNATRKLFGPCRKSNKECYTEALTVYDIDNVLGQASTSRLSQQLQNASSAMDAAAIYMAMRTAEWASEATQRRESKFRGLLCVLQVMFQAIHTRCALGAEALLLYALASYHTCF